MEQSNMQLSEEMRWHRRRLIVITAIVVAPIILSLIMRFMLGYDDYASALLNLKQGFQDGWFFYDSGRADATLYLVLVHNIASLMLVHSLLCLTGGIIIIYLAIKRRLTKTALMFCVPYLLISLISLVCLFTDYNLTNSASLLSYNRISLLGFDVRVMRGAASLVLYSLLGVGYFAFLWSELAELKKGAKK